MHKNIEQTWEVVMRSYPMWWARYPSSRRSVKKHKSEWHVEIYWTTKGVADVRKSS